MCVRPFRCMREPYLSTVSRPLKSDSIPMSLKRYTKAVDGTIPVQALLYEDEESLSTQEGIGIYDG